MIFGDQDIWLGIPPEPIILHQAQLKTLFQQKPKIGIAIDGSRIILDNRTYLDLGVTMLNPPKKVFQRLALAFESQTLFYATPSVNNSSATSCRIEKFQPFYFKDNVYCDGLKLKIVSVKPILISQFLEVK